MLVVMVVVALPFMNVFFYLLCFCYSVNCCCILVINVIAWIFIINTITITGRISHLWKMRRGVLRHFNKTFKIFPKIPSRFHYFFFFFFWVDKIWLWRNFFILIYLSNLVNTMLMSSGISICLRILNHVNYLPMS